MQRRLDEFCDGTIAHAREVGTLAKPFHFFDRSGTGLISREDFARGMSRLGMTLPARDLEELLALFDTDGDGRYDKATTFLSDIPYPTAVLCWDGGVFIGAAPNIHYAKDTDGDGVADESKVVLSGFGSDLAGEAHLNSFRWGPDNRIHLSTNLSGGDVVLARWWIVRRCIVRDATMKVKSS